MDSIDTDLCIIGAGAAGLSVASTAALLGVPVVLVEKAEMGGDCLHRGCVPSKALIAAAAHVAAARAAPEFGVSFGPANVEGPEVMARLRRVIAGIAPIDSAERYRALGVRVIAGEARFVAPRIVEAAGSRIRARRFVIATGGRPAIPDVPGLAETPYLTSDTVFGLADLPTRLAVLGGGPVGCELAQAFRRLGAAVTLIEAGRLLAAEDAEAVAVVRRRLIAEGVAVHEGARIDRIQPLTSGLTLDLSGPDAPAMLNEGQLIVATGRLPDLDGLGLEAAGVAHTDKGIVVDARQRTSNPRVFAIGDCAEGPRFTHAAARQAQVVIRNAVFRQRARFDPLLVPRATYTDPEIAGIGPSETEARARGGGVQTLRFPFSENDRARTDGRTEGFVKLIVDRRERILGATVVGVGAADFIAPVGLAMQNGLKIGALSDMIAPYPTRAETVRRAALQALAPKLRSPWVGRLIRWARRLG